MRLCELFKDVDCMIQGPGDTVIEHLSYDSRDTRPGSLFFCIEGFSQDGNRFASAAVSAGAAAIMAEHPHPDLDVPQVIVSDARKAMARASATFYGHPARSLCMVGVTGTNGKTTTTYMYKRLAEAAGRKVGLLGTICNLIGDRQLYARHTTPEAPDLQRLLSQMLDEGCDTCVMEVSSHALALDRTFGIPFRVGIFTNLTQDHLDFHETTEAYLEAKQRLFRQSDMSLINADDPAAAAVCRAAAGSCRTYGIFREADYMARDVMYTSERTAYTFSGPSGMLIPVAVPVPGRFTVYNSLAALAAAACSGISVPDAAPVLASMPHVAGRFEVLDTRGQPFTIILDYAHTPDSLENALRTVRDFAPGRVVTIFGCGGNRDRSKRPQMGSISVQYSDITYVTSDNPRFEEPEAIIDDILAGVQDMAGVVRLADRRTAISEAIRDAQPGDVLLLAGKGHETYQEIRGVRYDFDEKIVVQELLDEQGY